MVNRQVEQLYHKAHSAEDILCKIHRLDEKVALKNYIGNLYDFIGRVSGNNVGLDMHRIFGDKKQYEKFQKQLDYYELKMLEHFILKKKVHNSFIGDCMFGIGDSLEALGGREDVKETILSDKDFYDIFWQFMNSYHLDSLFEEYVKEGKIYSADFDNKNNEYGYTIVDPFTYDSDVFVINFQNTLSSMFSLAHEFGHVYDYKRFCGGIKDYNEYFYQSFYEEVFSRTFEKLFLDYLVKNNILLKEAEDKLFETAFTNYEYLLGAYILTLFPDYYIEDGYYEVVDDETVLQLVKHDFEDEEVIRDFIKDGTYFSVSEDFTYSYGSILSSFMKNAIQEDGFDHPLIEDFLKIRSKMFQESFLERNDITPDKYVRYHDDEIKVLKK
jgi:hypothetical protein